MTECLQTKKSNCKNCYKCIRHCPVKSLKFTDGQAHIVRDECVLCGECYVVCPQNAKQIRSDVEKAKQLVLKYDVYASIAPSFVAWFHNKSIHDMEQALIKLGFKGADETAKGAYIVKKQNYYIFVLPYGKHLDPKALYRRNSVSGRCSLADACPCANAEKRT